MTNERILTYAQWKRRKRLQTIGLNALIVVLMVCALALFAVAISSSEPHGYYMRCTCSDFAEEHFTYVTERKCEVISVANEEIAVAYGGNVYSFSGDGYKAGDNIICRFSEDMECLGVVR